MFQRNLLLPSSGRMEAVDSSDTLVIPPILNGIRISNLM